MNSNQDNEISNIISGFLQSQSAENNVRITRIGIPCNHANHQSPFLLMRDDDIQKVNEFLADKNKRPNLRKNSNEEFYIKHVKEFVKGEIARSSIVVKSENSYQNLVKLCNEIAEKNIFEETNIDEILSYNILSTNSKSPIQLQEEIPFFKDFHQKYKDGLIFKQPYCQFQEKSVYEAFIYEICTELPKFIKEIDQHKTAERTLTPDQIKNIKDNIKDISTELENAPSTSLHNNDEPQETLSDHSRRQSF